MRDNSNDTYNANLANDAIAEIKSLRAKLTKAEFALSDIDNTAAHGLFRDLTHEEKQIRSILDTHYERKS